MRWQTLQRLLGLQRPYRHRRESEGTDDTQPQVRIDSYVRLSHMDEHGSLSNRPSNNNPLRPIHPGDAAALGQRLAGRDKWVRVDAEGHAELVQVDKQEVVQKLWIPFRDLLQLDPEVPIAYPSSIFIRERALVVNLESVRMIIAKDEAYVTSVPVDGSAELWQHPTLELPFIRDLSDRLAADPSKMPRASYLRTSQTKVDREMPFELQALEAALAEGAKVLEIAVSNLERAAFPALERLLRNVSRSELDRTRNVKTVTTHLLNRVGRIRKELEEILDDDQDMADMYLGRREELEVAEPRRRASMDAQHASQASNQSAGSSLREESSARKGESPTAESHSSDREGVDLSDDAQFVTYHSDEDVLIEEFRPHRGPRGPRELRTAHPHDIEDCENLLENYFMQAEFLYSRLMQLKERTDDTEDLINIELDQRRNELLELKLDGPRGEDYGLLQVSLDLILTALATAFGFVACVGGIFGMNLAPLPIESTEVGFWVATFGASAAGLLLLVGFLGYAYWKKILLIPSA